MNRCILRMLSGGLLFLIGGVMPVYAQVVTARVPFEFRAGGAVLRAETYTISYSEANPWILTFQGTDGSKHEVRIITRLAQKETPSLDTYLVFDKIGEVYLFSEFWLPAMDGFFLGGDPLTHDHVIVKAKVQQEILP